jgi:hypothetical protein
MLIKIYVMVILDCDTVQSGGSLFFTETYCLHTWATVGYFITLTVSEIMLHSLFWWFSDQLKNISQVDDPG